jgi:hypothetical protein
MKMISYAKMPWSADDGWPELAQRRPALLDLVASLVLPLTLLPPAVLYLAGARDAAAFAPLTPSRDWAAVAVGFFFAEMLTFVGMGWLIKQVAQTYALPLDYHDAYLLAAIVPVPLWLASLGLLLPSMMDNLVLSTLALGLSCGLLYNGLIALGHTREEMAAARVVHVVFGATLMAWALLFAGAFL